MNDATSAQVIAIQSAMHSVLCELLILLPKDQRALLRERVQEHADDQGRTPIDEYEPLHSELLAQQYRLWDQLLAGPMPG